LKREGTWSPRVKVLAIDCLNCNVQTVRFAKLLQRSKESASGWVYWCNSGYIK
jgi:hypothetical protein